MALVACQRKQAYDFCVDIRWVDVFSVRFLLFSLRVGFFFRGGLVSGVTNNARTYCTSISFLFLYVVRFCTSFVVRYGSL